MARRALLWNTRKAGCSGITTAYQAGEALAVTIVEERHARYLAKLVAHRPPTLAAMAPHPEVIRPLIEAHGSRREAVDALMPVVYAELRVLAHHQLGRIRPDATLGTTALVHEAYVKLVDQSRATIRDRKHFFTVAALAMRQIVVDYARRCAAQKRGGGAAHALIEEFDGSAVPVEAQASALVALDDALTRLSHLDERLARVVELRFFGGLSVEDVAETLEVSTATVKRDTRTARAFLVRELGDAGGG
jgi:RNA polymerase sigma factor (TIGR02999 family)